MLLHHLSAHRTLILFDQAGVGRSTGEVANTYQGWADNVIALVEALGHKQIDLAGFSMGGRTVQMVTLARPDLIRKLICLGTDASDPPPLPTGSDEVRWPRGGNPRRPFELLRNARTVEEGEEAIRVSFFPDGQKGEKAAKRYFDRVRRAVKESGDGEEMLTLLGPEGTKQQVHSSARWNGNEGSWPKLHEIKCPVLVMNGDDDLLVSAAVLITKDHDANTLQIATPRSYELMSRIENAQLIIYPRAGHGFLWHYPESVATHINMFLDDREGVTANAKL